MVFSLLGVFHLIPDVDDPEDPEYDDAGERPEDEPLVRSPGQGQGVHDVPPYGLARAQGNGQRKHRAGEADQRHDEQVTGGEDDEQALERPTDHEIAGAGKQKGLHGQRYAVFFARFHSSSHSAGVSSRIGLSAFSISFSI